MEVRRAPLLRFHDPGIPQLMSPPGQVFALRLHQGSHVPGRPVSTWPVRGRDHRSAVAKAAALQLFSHQPGCRDRAFAKPTNADFPRDNGANRVTCFRMDKPRGKTPGGWRGCAAVPHAAAPLARGRVAGSPPQSGRPDRARLALVVCYAGRAVSDRHRRPQEAPGSGLQCLLILLTNSALSTRPRRYVFETRSLRCVNTWGFTLCGVAKATTRQIYNPTYDDARRSFLAGGRAFGRALEQ